MDLLKRALALHAHVLPSFTTWHGQTVTGAGTHMSPRCSSHLVYKDLSKASASQPLQALGPRGDSGSKQYGQTVLSVVSLLEDHRRRRPGRHRPG